MGGGGDDLKWHTLHFYGENRKKTFEQIDT